MRSAGRTENPLFTRARVRLTAWYVIILAAVLLVLGTSLYVLVREQTLARIDSGIKVTLARAQANWTASNTTGMDALDRTPYYVKGFTDLAIFRSPREQQLGLPDVDSLNAALQHGDDHRTIGHGDTQFRVFSHRVEATAISPAAVIQVARSTKPEREALGNLLFGLLLGGLAGLVLAAVGGWFLAGKSLAPVKEAFEHQRTFVADASHELRTPLAVIRANAEYLSLEEPENAELHEILRESDRLANLVDSLLSLARGDRRAERAQAALFDLGETVDGAVQSMQPLAADRQVELTVSTTGLTVLGDPEGIRQVVIILLDNALRYTAEGGRVHVQAAADGGTAMVTVHDTGIGIPSQALGHVFERFYRADDARSRESGGSGLGLAIAQELARQHGGKIEVESAEGVGTTFVVRLPLARAAPDRIER
jgi:two-component system sensor histidine kinase CiaH